MIIHIAGTFGSGKTFIGSFFNNLYPVNIIKVIDLDNIILPVLDDPKYKKMNNVKAIKMTMEKIGREIEKIKKKYQNILFVGYDYVYTTENNKKKYHRVLINADYKFFIDGDIDKFIKQYRSRTIAYAESSTDEVVIESNTNYKKIYNADKKLYKNYTFSIQENIIRRIIKLLEC